MNRLCLKTIRREQNVTVGAAVEVKYQGYLSTLIFTNHNKIRKLILSKTSFGLIIPIFS